MFKKGIYLLIVIGLYLANCTSQRAVFSEKNRVSRNDSIVWDVFLLEGFQKDSLQLIYDNRISSPKIAITLFGADCTKTHCLCFKTNSGFIISVENEAKSQFEANIGPDISKDTMGIKIVINTDTAYLCTKTFKERFKGLSYYRKDDGKKFGLYESKKRIVWY